VPLPSYALLLLLLLVRPRYACSASRAAGRSSSRAAGVALPTSHTTTHPSASPDASLATAAGQFSSSRSTQQTHTVLKPGKGANVVLCGRDAAVHTRAFAGALP
jgi:hypothetical protein